MESRHAPSSESPSSGAARNLAILREMLIDADIRLAQFSNTPFQARADRLPIVHPGRTLICVRNIEPDAIYLFKAVSKCAEVFNNTYYPDCFEAIDSLLDDIIAVRI